jgi:hypothetical protein
VATMNSTIFWVVTTCTRYSTYLHGVTTLKIVLLIVNPVRTSNLTQSSSVWKLHHVTSSVTFKESQTSVSSLVGVCIRPGLLHLAGRLLGLFFDAEDGGMFFRIPNYMTLEPRSSHPLTRNYRYYNVTIPL